MANTGALARTAPFVITPGFGFVLVFKSLDLLKSGARSKQTARFLNSTNFYAGLQRRTASFLLWAILRRWKEPSSTAFRGTKLAFYPVWLSCALGLCFHPPSGHGSLRQKRPVCPLLSPLAITNEIFPPLFSPISLTASLSALQSDLAAPSPGTGGAELPVASTDRPRCAALAGAIIQIHKMKASASPQCSFLVVLL